MAKEDRYNLTQQDKAILTQPGGWRDMLDRMELSEADRLKYSSNKVNKKELKNG